jgi:hypothetical protein
MGIMIGLIMGTVLTGVGELPISHNFAANVYVMTDF